VGEASKSLLQIGAEKVRNLIETGFDSLEQRVRQDNPHPLRQKERAWDDMMNARRSGADQATQDKLRQKYLSTPSDE